MLFWVVVSPDYVQLETRAERAMPVGGVGDRAWLVYQGREASQPDAWSHLRERVIFLGFGGTTAVPERPCSVVVGFAASHRVETCRRHAARYRLCVILIAT